MGSSLIFWDASFHLDELGSEGIDIYMFLLSSTLNSLLS